MRVGVIGAGKVGQLRVQTIKENPRTDLAAVLDVSMDAAKRAVAGTDALATSDMVEFLNNGLDIVFVSIPPHLHREAATAAFESGCHVFCEKPMAHTAEDGQAMVDAAVAAGRKLGVGFNLRYYPFVTAVREAVDRGQIGKITHVRVFGGHNGLHNFTADWQYKMPESGGGAMMDIGIHMTDLARYFLGDITDVYGVMSEAVWNIPGSEDNAIAIFKNPQGIAASYHATWYEWTGYRSVVEVYGDRGMARGYYAPMQTLIITRDENGNQKKSRQFFPHIILREKLKSWTSTALLSFKGELADFIHRIEETGDGPAADGHDGLRALEVSEAVRESTRTGEVVHLEPLGRMI